MAVNLSPVGGVAAQFFTNTGAVLTGGKIYTYAAGTTTPAVTYTSSQGTTAWTNPIVLDAAGRVSGSGEIWLTDGINYKFVLKDSTDVLIATYDNISGINSNFVSYTSDQEIVTATSGQTVFNLGISYQPGTNSLSVFVDGVNQYGPGAQYAYTETDSNTVTFTSGLHVGAEVKFTTSQQQGAGAVDASQVTYDPPFTGSVATNVEVKLSEYVSVQDFGADSTGVLDSTSAIQAAINSGKRVYVPTGVYKTSSPLTITANNTSIYGDGSGSIIQTNSLTDDVFTLGNGSTEVSGLLFQDFTVWSSVIKTGGYAFNARFVTDSQWQNVSAGSQDLYTTAGGHRLYRGWYFDRFDTIGVYGGWCVTSHDGIRMRGNADDTYSAELVIDGNMRFARQNASGACGVRIGGNCGGVYLRRGDVSLAETGVIIDTTLSLAATTATKRNREVFIQGFNVDSCKKWGISQVGESVALLIMDNPWAASCGTDDDGSGGIIIGGGLTIIPVVSISGSPYLYNNVGPGIEIDGGFVTIDGGQIYSNGRSASGGHGIQFGATLPPFFSVVGTDISYNGNVTKGYGIVIPAGLNNFNVSALTIHNNGQGAINNLAGYSNTKIIQACFGFLTVNSGSASVGAGNTSIVVSHGLTFAPSLVLITPAGAPENAGWYVDNITSVQFTIYLNATSTTTRNFYWRVSVPGQ
jgi:hypothetical protein